MVLQPSLSEAVATTTKRSASLSTQQTLDLAKEHGNASRAADLNLPADQWVQTIVDEQRLGHANRYAGGQSNLHPVPNSVNHLHAVTSGVGGTASRVAAHGSNAVAAGGPATGGVMILRWGAPDPVAAGGGALSAGAVGFGAGEWSESLISWQAATGSGTTGLAVANQGALFGTGGPNFGSPSRSSSGRTRMGSGGGQTPSADGGNPSAGGSEDASVGGEYVDENEHRIPDGWGLPSGGPGGPVIADPVADNEPTPPGAGVTMVPEPSTLVIFAFGSLGLAICGTRRRKSPFVTAQ